MAWVKTDAGRLEMQTRSLVHARPQRNLLLLIDGRKTEEQLLASVAGVTAADLLALRDLGLISSPDHPAAAAPVAFPTSAPMTAATPVRVDAAHAMPVPLADVAAPAPVAVPEPLASATAPPHVDIPLEPLPAAPRPSFDQVSKTLTSLIASELGLRGFTLTLAVERASGIDALLEVADRVVAQIEHRKGPVAADKARRALFGR